MWYVLLLTLLAGTLPESLASKWCWKTVNSSSWTLQFQGNDSQIEYFNDFNCQYPPTSHEFSTTDRPSNELQPASLHNSSVDLFPLNKTIVTSIIVHFCNESDKFAEVKAELYKSSVVCASCKVTDATSKVNVTFNVTFSCPKEPFDFIRIAFPSVRPLIRQIEVFTECEMAESLDFVIPAVIIVLVLVVAVVIALFLVKTRRQQAMALSA